MVDLQAQYQRLQVQIDETVLRVIASARYIGGPEVDAFKTELRDYLGAEHVIPCANGTDALQISMMALGLKPDDEVIVPTFTYVATAEVIALLGLTPVLVDVDAETFTIDIGQVEAAITHRTKAIVPVHLFGQCADMEMLLPLAEKHGISIVEDNAQAIGSDYFFSDGKVKRSGTMGTFGCTSFFPSKNLGCFGDGGAICTNDGQLAEAAAIIAAHGQSRLYVHDRIGCNSRLDALQAAVLRIKLPHLDDFIARRTAVADKYDRAFAGCDQIKIPARNKRSKHVFHQYTVILDGVDRNGLRSFLQSEGIPSMIYYPIPLHKQKAFKDSSTERNYPVTEHLCDHVLSLPMHTEMQDDQIEHIISRIIGYLNQS